MLGILSELVQLALADRSRASVHPSPHPCSSGLFPCHFLACQPVSVRPWMKAPWLAVKPSERPSPVSNAATLASPRSDFDQSNHSGVRKMAKSLETPGHSDCAFGQERRLGGIAQEKPRELQWPVAAVS